MTPELKFLISVSLILLSTVAGYLCRKRELLDEGLSKSMMTFVMVFGYTTVSVLSIWKLKLNVAHAWLPILGGLQIVLMIMVGLAFSKLITSIRSKRGLFAICMSMGNNGLTMGGFIVYQLLGENGLGLASIYGLMWTPIIVFVLYPVAIHFSSRKPNHSIGKLLVKSVFNWRAIGMPMSIVAIVLSLSNVPRPDAIADFHIIDILVFVVTAMAYFSIGLRLHLSRVAPLKKQIISLAACRFGIGLAAGWALVAVTYLTPWPMVAGITRDVFIIQSFVPVAITAVAIANMFGLHPRQASALFVTNTAAYIAAVLPFVVWIYG